MKTATRCVRSESNGDSYGAISPPIYQTATFRQDTVDEFGEYDYTRSGNPTRTLVERQIADLEGGAHACAFASGMAAITALTRLVSPGEEILCGSDLYGGTIRLLDQVVQRMGISVNYVDTCDLDSVRTAITPQTKLLLLESPTNPLLRISDIEAIAALTAKRAFFLQLITRCSRRVFNARCRSEQTWSFTRRLSSSADTAMSPAELS
jgi:cystathionine beta-lyase